MEVEALDRQTGLPAVEEAADARRADGGVDVGVVENDHRVGAAELEGHALDAARRELGDVLADGSRAGERDLRHARIGDERLAEHGALAGDDLEDALGQAVLAHDLGDAERRQRRRLGRLGDDDVAADERGPELVAEQRRREVPGHDRDDDAERALQDEPVRADVEARHVGAAEVLRETRVVLERVDEARDLQPSLAQRLALLERQLRRQLVTRGQDRRGGLVQELSAASQPASPTTPGRRPRHVRPRLEASSAPRRGTRPTSSPVAGLRMTVTSTSVTVAIGYLPLKVGCPLLGERGDPLAPVFAAEQLLDRAPARARGPAPGRERAPRGRRA